MTIGRRDFLVATGVTGAAAAATLAGVADVLALPPLVAAQPSTMYGLIGKMLAVPGQRDALVAILLEGTGAMPGCLSYVVAHDSADANAIWITEVWRDQASHAASLQLPAVRDAIARGRPLIAGFDSHVVTTPVGGQGLK